MGVSISYHRMYVPKSVTAYFREIMCTFFYLVIRYNYVIHGLLGDNSIIKIAKHAHLSNR